MIVAQLKLRAGGSMIEEEDRPSGIVEVFKTQFQNFSCSKGASPILCIGKIDLNHNDLPGLDLFPSMFTQDLSSFIDMLYLESVYKPTVSKKVVIPAKAGIQGSR
jgi:hypothetical protein